MSPALFTRISIPAVEKVERVEVITWSVKALSMVAGVWIARAWQPWASISETVCSAAVALDWYVMVILRVVSLRFSDVPSVPRVEGLGWCSRL